MLRVKKTYKTKVLYSTLVYLTVLLAFFSNALAITNNDTSVQDTSLTEPLKPAQKNTIKSSFVMRGASFKEGPDEAQFVQLLFNPKVKINLSDSWKLSADATLSLNSSRVQTRFNDPSLNSINANELLLSYVPNENLKISAGAINQKHLDAPALVQSDLAFTGIIASYLFKYDNLDFTIKGQYTIPNSTSLESDRTGNEDLPSFFTQGIEAKWTPKTWIKFDANVNYFSYSDLPSIVAFNSGRLGNEVRGVNQSESSFLFDFSGFSQSYSVNFDVTKRVSPFISLRSVDNLDAPSKRERAQSVGFGAEFNFKDFSVTPGLAFFYSESDASPAVYTDPRFGRNNREGETYSLGFNFKKLGFTLDLAYVNSDLIQERAVQNDMEYFELQLGVANVTF